jgi:plasmid stabilization system protein ParE
MNWATTPAADADLIQGREWIEADNPEAAQIFLKAARECFDRLDQFPKLGAETKIKVPPSRTIRFMVLSPPFNRWIVFYRVTRQVEIIRVLYGTQNWQRQPKRFC